MISCSSRIAWSTRASVEKPVLPRRLRDSLSFSKRMCPSCCGEPIVNSSPASSHTRRSSSAPREPKRSLMPRRRSTSSLTPARSISTSTSTSGSSTSWKRRVRPSSSSRARWRSADVEGLLPLLLAERARSLRREGDELAVERPDLRERDLARLGRDDLLGALGGGPPPHPPPPPPPALPPGAGGEHPGTARPPQ